MERTYWQKQKSDQPLFSELLWSRPENTRQAGKLLIIGGNLHAFMAPAEAFATSVPAGIGSARVLLPDAAKKLVGSVLEDIDYAPSTPSGSFSQKALVDWLATSQWADGVLITGDLGRNSETSILLEKFLQKYTGQVTLTKDAVDYAIQIPNATLNRPDTLLVLSFAQLQKLAIKSGFTSAFTFSMDLLHLVEALHTFTETYQTYIIVQHLSQTHIAVNGNIVSYPIQKEASIWRVKTAAHTAVWWLQNPGQPLEALSTALFEMKES